MASVNAWLLHTSAGFHMATGEHELVEVIAAPKAHRIPATPPHCHQVIVWREHLLPLMRPAVLAGRDGGAEQPRFVAIAAFQEAPGEPLQYGALALAEPPASLRVEPGPASEPPSLEGVHWDDLLVSCLEYEGKPVVILDLETLFTTVSISP